MNRPALIDLAAEAIWREDGYDLNADPESRVAHDMRPIFMREARKVLDAIVPLIVSDLRASIVADIEAIRPPHTLIDAHQATFAQGVAEAALVAGGGER